MKFILVFVLWIAIANAGVSTWSQSQEDEAIDMYRKFCETGDSGISGDIHWHCKYPDEDLSDESVEHHFTVTAKPHVEKQIFFVQTQGKHSIHKISVHGEGINKQDVTIYVLPPKHEHKIEINGDITVDIEELKPKTSFVKKHPFTFQLPEGHSATLYPEPFGTPFVAKSPDLQTLDTKIKLEKEEIPNKQEKLDKNETLETNKQEKMNKNETLTSEEKSEKHRLRRAQIFSIETV